MEDSTGPQVRDEVLTAAKATLSLVPGGGIFAALLDYYIPKTWQLQQDKLLEQLKEDFDRLKGKVNDNRLSSEGFHITMIKIMRDALVEPHKEKQEAFRAILLNDAMASSLNAEEDLFIKITEDLTHEHIRVLKVLADPDRVLQENPAVRQSIRSVRSTNSSSLPTSDIPTVLLHPALPEIPPDHWEVLLDGLARYGLIVDLRFTGGGWRGTYPAEHIMKKRTTALGDRYIESITLPR